MTTHNVEDKSQKELVEIVKIQEEEFAKLQQELQAERQRDMKNKHRDQRDALLLELKRTLQNAQMPVREDINKVLEWRDLIDQLYGDANNAIENCGDSSLREALDAYNESTGEFNQLRQQAKE